MSRPRKKPTYTIGERVSLKGDKYSRPWIVIGLPAHGTTIQIQREGRTPSIYTQVHADPDDLKRLEPKDKETRP